MPSKLPKIGTSVFAVMSGLAKQTGAINLSQGFPDFPVSKEIIQLVHKYMKQGYNQYAPMTGVQELREVLSDYAFKKYNTTYHPEKEVNITSGATQGIFTIISAFIRSEDEVIVFEPAYDSYAPAVELNGGIPRFSQLQHPDYSINWEEVKQLINDKTKMIIINSPHNPTGSVLKESDMKELIKITQGTDILLLSDEVYEHIIFDNIKHQSICYYPELVSRSFMVGSFGKTFHATGWKTGFVFAPEELMKEFRKSHQFTVFASNTPIQYALAEFMRNEDNYKELGGFYQQKRDEFLSLIQNSRFNIIPCFGTYFQLLDYSNISEDEEYDFAIRLTKENGIASIPVSPFYHNHINNHSLRFCFAKQSETLQKAAEILCKI